MNIKKCSLKTMCAALACTTFLSSMLAAYATDAIITETPIDESAGAGAGDSSWTTEENSFEDIKVTYQQSSSYFVTIPKTIALDLNKQAIYSVKVTGEIDTKQRVYVAPVDGITETENLDFYMKEKDNNKADVVATVTQNKIYWNSEEVANEYEETNNSVSAPDLAAGTWEGTFQMEIRLESEHVEAEPDPYEVAPENAYSNWNYTLDDENNIITLNYYIGSETDVIVYANYVIGGKTYKTQIASNADDAHYQTTKYMFNGFALESNQNIRSIKFSDSIDTSNVTNMNDMFYYCKALASLDISCFNTSNVTSMRNMFAQCTSLEILDISNFDTSNVTNMYSMFNHVKCRSLDLSNFNTSKVTNMGGMFYYANSLEELKLSSFDTSNVTDMEMMFSQCTALTSLDLSGFDTKNVVNMKSMFSYSNALNSIYVSEDKWITSQAQTSFMFLNCGTNTVSYK